MARAIRLSGSRADHGVPRTHGAGPPTDRAAMLELVERQLRVLGDKIPDTVAEDCDLASELGLDSLDLLEFIANVEYALHMEFPRDVLPGLTSMGSVTDYALRRVSEEGRGALP